MSLPGTDLLSLVIQLTGTVLFSLVFLFLWRQSGIVYFGLWGAAWAAEAGALAFAWLFIQTSLTPWLIFYAFLEFAFAILLVAAARAGFSGTIRNWKSALYILLAFPFFLGIVFAVDWQGTERLHALHAVVLGAVYVYNFSNIHGPRLGARLFRFSLLSLAVAFFYHALLLLYLYHAGATPEWVTRLHYNLYYDFALHSLLAFSAMAMWIESQQDRVRELGAELDRVRRESALNRDLDRLTGLMNQSALFKRMEDAAAFHGVAAVCDMDEFKEINDRYGHLVGDEILRAVGHLLRTSIRPEDEAFRWGGDEFVVLFHNGDPEVAANRMREIASRLRGFRVRGHGILPISFSWGTADDGGRPLREVVDDADRKMYELKRGRR
jgi:diguanylate cyclase (GGDEF)-like protein